LGKLGFESSQTIDSDRILDLGTVKARPRKLHKNVMGLNFGTKHRGFP